MNDIKVIDTLKEMAEAENNPKPFHPIAFFAENLAITRRGGISIEDIAKCFKAQFDKDELDALIKELTKE